MAKALFGHVGVGNDVRLADEVSRLRRRVRDLEDELARSAAVNDAIRDALAEPGVALAGSALAGSGLAGSGLVESTVESLREPALA